MRLSREPLPSLLILGAVLLLGGCRRGDPDELQASTPTPAAAIGFDESPRLEDRLARLHRELQGVLSTHFEDDLQNRLARIEAITDRLLESRAPVQWLATDYSLEARLRQVQALADRVVAELRRGGSDDDMHRDVRELDAQVVNLQKTLALRGGGRAPPSLDSLLAAVRNDVQNAQEGAGGE